MFTDINFNKYIFISYNNDSNNKSAQVAENPSVIRGKWNKQVETIL